MRHKLLSIGIALVCLLCVAAVGWWGFVQRTSPGPLHATHNAVRELRGNRGCTACHGSGAIAASDSLAAACNVCHTVISDQLAQGTGIHGTHRGEKATRCESCHREHLADAIPLISDASFKNAGIPDRDLYDHAHVPSWLLTGRHGQLMCRECHPAADNQRVSKGESRFLGLTQACTRCHEDVHRGELGAACAECHGQEAPFKDIPYFSHPAAFPLTEGHSRRLCSECHTTPQLFTGLATDCASCHIDTYGATTLPSHTVAGLGTDCAACHTTVTWDKATYTHPDTFSLVGAHAELACATCHTKGDLQRRVIAFGAGPTCAACHDSPHTPAFVDAAARTRPDATDACTVCHEQGDRSWSQGVPRLTPELHAATGFPLSRPHTVQKCAECHAGLEAETPKSRDLAERARRFPGRDPSSCEACHADPHRGQFIRSPSRGACTSCHESTTFFPTTFDAGRHADCAFPLEGGHRAVACATCHTKPAEVRIFVGTPQACADCHTDAHAGAFDAPGLPARVEGKAGCARCHTSTDFQKVAWTAADHGLWTGEALTGKHALASCNQCHRREVVRGGAPATMKPAPKACAQCHTDVHAGQFKVDAVTDCARCHRGTENFKPVTFNHDTDSRFVLDADHRELGCAACHQPFGGPGTAIIRYKPLGVRCADCHDSRPAGATSGGSSP